MELLERTAKKVLAAEYWDIFTSDKPEHLKHDYRQYARVLHPDHYSGPDRNAATEAFQRLNELHTQAQQAASEGRFGQPAVLAKIKSRTAVHKVKHLWTTGDIANLYLTDSTDSQFKHSTLLKVARSARDNDLLATEAKALKTLHGTGEKWTRAYPELVDTFLHRDGRRRANAVEFFEGHYSLQTIHMAANKGIDPRHVVWMWRRLLIAMDFAHRQGIIHGAVLPCHVLIGPQDHAVILVDWCYASIASVSGSPPNPTYDYPPIKALSKTYSRVTHSGVTWYPEEVLAKEPPSPATDIAMGARTMLHVLGERGPFPLRGFFKGCLLQKQRMRPQSAAILLQEFDELLKKMGEPYYPRRFLEFAVPAGTA